MLAGVENLVLAAEVVIEVGGGEVGGDGDVAHPGGREPHRAEDAGRGGEDFRPARRGAPRRAATLRTIVRNSNHCSIVRAPRRGVKRPEPAGRHATAYNGSHAHRSGCGRAAISYLAGIALPAAAVQALLVVPDITARAAAPVLLLLVLVIARSWGLGPALVATVSASVGYSYYFLPMAGVDAEALRLGFLTFTISAAIVAWLAARAEQRRREALAGRREIERLYQQLQSAFDRASEVEAVRRNEQLKAALLDALTHNLRTPLTAIKAAVTALIGTGGRTGWSGLSEREPPRAAPGDRRGIGPPEPLRRGTVGRRAPRR